MLTARFALVWTLANLAGIAAFLLIASQYWVEPEVADIPGANMGNAFGWAFFAVPVAALFGLANLALLLASLHGERWLRWWRSILFIVPVHGCWVAAWLFDNAHHGS